MDIGTCVKKFDKPWFTHKRTWGVSRLLPGVEQ